MNVKVDNDGPVTTVIINRPQVKNAVDRPTADALVKAFTAFEADDEACVAVLWGAGGHFCAGADLKAVASGERRNRTAPDGDGPMGPSRMLLSKPVIAAVAGSCVAGGLELALWCDLRVAEETAVFGVYCRRWGVPLIDGGTVRLPRAIGMSRALDMILTGRGVKAAEAYEMGLANRIVAEGESRQAAEALAAELARFPQTCLRQDRRSAYEQWGIDQDTAIANEFENGRKALEEAVKGAARFAEGAGRHGSFENFETDQ